VTDPFQVELRPPPGGGTGQQALAHSCSYTGASGIEYSDPPIRIKFFLDQFPNRSTFTTICQPDLSGGLQQIAQLLKTALGNPCIEGKLKMPVDCSVSDVTNYLKPNQMEKVLPQCDANASNKPCWRIATDTNLCAAGDHLTLRIEGQDTLPQDTHVVANCVTEVTSN
ncbi:MAG TPA: hypothetical protein VFD36_19445, partial [Kofleriaceae bacterium]|nr:hypothetical protein [Kofleriaceae bacterium]